MKKLNSKKQVFEYIKHLFARNSNVILIRGSAVNKPLKAFSDIDVEVYGKIKKPYYKIIFVKNHPILMSTYFYKFKKGRKVKAAKNIKVLYGEYNNKIKPDFSKDTYTPKEKIKRECQLMMDFMFRYLRSGDKKALASLERRLK
jgi:hypothetical protein